MPTCVKNLRKAIPSTTFGIMSGERKSAVSAWRPGNR